MTPRSTFIASAALPAWEVRHQLLCLLLFRHFLLFCHFVTLSILTWYLRWHSVRVRSANDVAGRGRALLFLLPSELGFLKYLRNEKVPLNEYEFPQKKIANVQAQVRASLSHMQCRAWLTRSRRDRQLEKLIAKNYFLHRSAKDGYRSYIMAYASHSHKDIFNVHDLDLLKVSRSFGFETPPSINLSASLIHFFFFFLSASCNSGITAATLHVSITLTRVAQMWTP